MSKKKNKGNEEKPTTGAEPLTPFGVDNPAFRDDLKQLAATQRAATQRAATEEELEELVAQERSAAIMESTDQKADAAELTAIQRRAYEQTIDSGSAAGTWLWLTQAGDQKLPEGHQPLPPTKPEEYQ